MTHTFSPKLKQSARPQAANSKSSMESHGGRTTAPQSQPAFGEQAIQPGVAAHPDCAAGIPAAALPLRLSQIPIHPRVPPATPRANGVPLDAGVRARYEYNLGKSLGNVAFTPTLKPRPPLAHCMRRHTPLAATSYSVLIAIAQ